jgi:hypothetical protein
MNLFFVITGTTDAKTERLILDMQTKHPRRVGYGYAADLSGKVGRQTIVRIARGETWTGLIDPDDNAHVAHTTPFIVGPALPGLGRVVAAPDVPGIFDAAGLTL